MMDNLKGKTILVGKEPGNGRLYVSVNVNGQHKVAPIGEMQSVPNSVSRCKPGENTAHCKITVGGNGEMTITNMKPQNVTYVNGTEVMSKRLKAGSRVELGRDHYVMDLNAVIMAAQKIVGVTHVQPTYSKPTPQMSPPQMPTQEYSIRHLKRVWDDYNSSVRDIKIRQKNIGLLSSIPMGFSMFGGLVAGIAPEIREIAIVFTCIALLIMLIGFYKRFTDKSIYELEELSEELQRNYVCPNPQCHHFMGNQPYNVLRQNKTCPHCKCKLTEK